MQTLFDPAVYQEILRRVDTVQPGSKRQWGKMTAAQMFEHTSRALEKATGKKPSRQSLMGKLIGWMFRDKFLGAEPFPRNSPTSPEFVVQDEPDFNPTKERLKKLLGEFHSLGEKGCDGNVHGFFGKLTGRQWGETQHKHLDHHLRQFGA